MAAILKRSWIDRLRRRSAVAGAQPGQGDGDPVDPLMQAGERLRQAREHRALSLRQLADQTRISTAVLEALERGWPDRLPEPAYLRTMLPLLERFLELEPASLRGALHDAQADRPRTTQRPVRLPWLSVQLFSTWQGSAIYGALLLLLLYALNLEQQRLAAQGLLSLRPMPPREEPSAARPQLLEDWIGGFLAQGHFAVLVGLARLQEIDLSPCGREFDVMLCDFWQWCSSTKSRRRSTKRADPASLLQLLVKPGRMRARTE